MTPRVKGLLFIAFSAFCFGLMSLLVKIAVSERLTGATSLIASLTGQPVSPAETLFYRSVLGWLGLLVVARWLNARGTHENPRLLVLRGLFGGLAVLAFFYAFAHTQLSKAALIGYAYPVFAILFSRLFFGERIQPRVLLLMAVALAGVALILKPDPDASFNRGDFAAVLAGVFSGAAIATLRRLRRDEATITVVLHFTFWGAVVSLPALAVSPPTIPDLPHVLLLVCIAVIAAVGQVFLTAGYKDCNTAEGGTMSLLNSVFTVAFGVILLGETLEWTTWVGGIMTLGTCLLLISPRNIPIREVPPGTTERRGDNRGASA
jgi:drug/metabolite transporter (DMT)-like permease